jgi:hypothetical protein
MEFVLEKVVNHGLKAYSSTICNMKNAEISHTVYTFHTIIRINDCFPKHNKPTCLSNRRDRNWVSWTSGFKGLTKYRSSYPLRRDD